MNPGRRQTWLLGAAGIIAAASGFLAGPALLRLGGNAESQALKGATFPDLAGKSRLLTEWKGRILVCNFWATWCAPCREEIPLLMEARQKYGHNVVEIVGIAVDNATKVRQYAESFKIPYPILLAEADGLDLMRRLGNSSGGLPYTVIADRGGTPVHRKLGALKQAELESLLDPLVRT